MFFDNVLWGKELLNIQTSKLFILAVRLTETEGRNLSWVETPSYNWHYFQGAWKP